MFIAQPFGGVVLVKEMFEPGFRRWLVISFALHLLLFVLQLIIPETPHSFTLSPIDKTKDRKVFRSSAAVTYPFKRIADFVPNLYDEMVEGPGRPAPGDEGKRGIHVPGTRKKPDRRSKNTGGVLSWLRGGSKNNPHSLLWGRNDDLRVAEKGFERARRYGLPGEREVREGKGLKGNGAGGGEESESLEEGLLSPGDGGGTKGPGKSPFDNRPPIGPITAVLDDDIIVFHGSLPKKEIQKIIENHIGRIRYCYERELQREPNLRGKIVTDFIIGIEGKVTDVKIKKSTIRNASVEKCVGDVIRQLRFPKPGGGIVEVIYPFLFRVAG